MADDYHAAEGGTIKSTLQSATAGSLHAEAPEILPSDITFGQELAKGNFGTVYKGRCRGEIVAIKELHDIDEEAFGEFKTEVAIMSHLRHPNIVLLMGAVTRGDVMCIITEFCKGGDLDRQLNDKTKEFSLAKKIGVLQDIAMGMNWLHCSVPPIIHRDLKPGNILLNEDYSAAKIGDLGLSAIQSRRKIKSYGAGSYLWMAPEALLEQPHTEKVDVYSFGIVMWQVLHWNPDPFKKYLDMGDLNKLIEAICQRNERPEIDAEVHPSLRTIIEAAWHQESRKRPSFASILVMLDDAIIKAVVTDKDAAEFWRRHFGRAETGKQIETTKRLVPFESFSTAFFKSLSEKYPSNPSDDKKFLCLRAIAAEKHPNYEKPVVSLDKFSCLFKWFGPMFPPNGEKFLDSMLAVVSNDWFHGDISKDEAQTLLTLYEKQHKHVDNAFLVRFSFSEPILKNPYTISKFSKAGSIVHQRVYFDLDTGEHYITVKEKGESSRFASKDGIVGLIRLITTQTKLLKTVVPRTKYHEIFHRHAEDMGYLDGDE